MAEQTMTGTAPQFRFGGSLFREFEDSVYATYATAITWRDRVAGGTPSDPKLIEGWLKGKAPGMTSDIERRYMLVRTLREMGAEIPEDQDLMAISMEQLEEAASRVAANRGANGFKRPNRRVGEDGTIRHPGFLAIETRHVKAHLKESINIVFAGMKWGQTRKGAKSFAAEHIFVNPVLDPAIIGEEVYQELTKPDPEHPQRRIPAYPDFLFLTRYNHSGDGPMFTMVTEPDNVETFIGHVSGPQGPRSNLTRVEVVSGATIHLELKVLRDEIEHHHWAMIALCSQEQGLGAMRSQGYGRHDVTRFERTGGKYPQLDWQDAMAKIDKDAAIAAFQRGKRALVESGELLGEATEGLVPVGAGAATGASTNGRGRKKAVAATEALDEE